MKRFDSPTTNETLGFCPAPISGSGIQRFGRRLPAGRFGQDVGHGFSRRNAGNPGHGRLHLRKGWVVQPEPAPCKRQVPFGRRKKPQAVGVILGGATAHWAAAAIEATPGLLTLGAQSAGRRGLAIDCRRAVLLAGRYQDGYVSPSRLSHKGFHEKIASPAWKTHTQKHTRYMARQQHESLPLKSTQRPVRKRQARKVGDRSRTPQ